jgi:hypothetical protein
MMYLALERVSGERAAMKAVTLVQLPPNESANPEQKQQTCSFFPAAVCSIGCPLPACVRRLSLRERSELAAVIRAIAYGVRQSQRRESNG